MKFTPRLVAPQWGDPYWFSNNPYYPNYGLPNCACYAYGRFYEILGSKPNLSMLDAGQWYNNVSDGYKRGNKPKLGAVLCWAKPGAPGHVAIVEKINSDGSIVTSESSWSYPRNNQNPNYFYTQTRKPSNYASSSFVFQGFIYNPAVEVISSDDPLNVFIKTAESQLGKDGSWSYRLSGLSVGQPWCAAFVTSCAITAKIVNKIIPHTAAAGNFARYGVQKGWGKWLPGPFHGNSPRPTTGDIVTFRWKKASNYSSSDVYYSDHVGIVKEVSSNGITTIEGNCGGKVKSLSYNLNDKRINGYYRPNWELVGSSGYYSDLSYTTYGSFQSLYSELNTKEDASLREVAYVNNAYEPSISKSNIRLSVVNYTTLLNAYYNSVASSYGGLVGSYGTEYNTDNLEAVPRQIVRFFVDKGMSQAVGIGIAACVKGECEFKIGLSVVDTNGKISCGMCMWNGKNGTNMINYVGSDWKTDLTGQLNYLWYDMTVADTSWFQYMIKRIYGTNVTIIEKLRQQPNTREGAKKCADIFVRVYGNGARPDEQSRTRQKFAEELWDKLIAISR